jgi:hypothetical protein
MLINHMGEAVPEHIDHITCRTQVKMDDLWQCLANSPFCCPDLIPYGTTKYCVHKDRVLFGLRIQSYVEGAIE